MNVKIGYRTYDIQLKGPLYSDASEKLYGQIDYDKKLIEISNEFDLEQQACTLLHEIIHGVSDDRAISLNEDQVNQLAIGLYQAMLDNQKLFKEVIII